MCSKASKIATPGKPQREALEPMRLRAVARRTEVVTAIQIPGFQAFSE
jgi:hypothetical protein